MLFMRKLATCTARHGAGPLWSSGAPLPLRVRPRRHRPNSRRPRPSSRLSPRSNRAAAAQQQAAAAQKDAAAARQALAVAQGVLPLGTVVRTLPAGCPSATVAGVEYYHCGGNYYRAAFEGNNLVYVTTQPK